MRLARSVCECGLEACILYPLSLALGSWLGGGALAPWWLLLAIVYGGWLGGAWVRAGRVGLAPARFLLTLAGLTLASSGAFWLWPTGEGSHLWLPLACTWLLLLGCWWRGLADGREVRASYEIESGFRLGTIGFVIAALLLWALGDPGQLLPRLVPAAMGMLLFGLASTALAAVEAVEAGGGVRVGRHWLAVVAGSLVLVLAGALLIAAVLPLGVLSGLLQPLAPLARLIVAGLLLLAVPIVFGLIYLAYLIRWLLAPFFASLGPVAAPAPREAQDWLLAWARSIPPDLLLVLAAAGVVLLLLGLLALLTSTLRRWEEAEVRPGVEERESLWRRPSAADLRRWIAGLWRRWFGRRLAADRSSTANQRQAPPLQGLRAIYRAWLLHLRARGLGRRPQETPRELADRLSAEGPHPALPALTTLYEGVRYGEQPEDEVRLAAARRALDELLEEARPGDQRR